MARSLSNHKLRPYFFRDFTPLLHPLMDAEQATFRKEPATILLRSTTILADAIDVLL